MPLDNSGTKMVLNRYGNLITTKDRTLMHCMWSYFRRGHDEVNHGHNLGTHMQAEGHHSTSIIHKTQ